jgi:hypothetical protein
METTNQSTNKSEIITLILADMRNRKLLMGLEATGLATDDFNTNLSDLIFSKMEIDRQHETIVFNWYEDTIYRLLDTDLNKFREHQLFLAERLYDALETKKKKLQTNLISVPKTNVSFLKWIGFGRFDN